MKFLVIGASRGIGLETVKRALARGHEVRAFARSAHNIAIDDTRLTKIAGDAHDLAQVAAAVSGADVVVEALGVPLDAESVLHGTDTFSRAARCIIDAMEQDGSPKRLIAVTGLGAGEARDHLGPLFGLAFQFSLKRVYDDKDIEEQMIKASSLDWTILRPGILRDGVGTGLYQILDDPSTWRVGSIRRADVAHCIVDAAENGLFIRQTPLLID